MTTADPTDVLDVRGLRVAFDRPVLRGVDLRIAPGECVAVVGGSGAGKSVLARALLGLEAAHSEGITLLGRDARRFSARQWRAARGRDVGLVLQDALGSLDPLRTVGAEVGEALTIRRPGAARPTAKQRADRVQDLLRRVGLPDPELRARQRSGQLSGGMRQRALIAAALSAAPPLLIADEPTTALDATVAARVLDLLADLRDGGTAILLISHDLGAVARVADRVLVLDEGVVVESGTVAEVVDAPRHEVTRRLVAAARLPEGPGPMPPPGAPVLVGRGLRRVFSLPGGAAVTAADDVDVELRAGEAIGLVGESGSGKTTLARLLLAADAPDAGTVELDGAAWSTASEAQRRGRRTAIRWVPQDPLGSMDPRLTVRGVLRDAGATDVAALLRTVHLDPALADRRPRTLSGGQRQRVAIARALAADPRVLILDEPVSALDVQVQAAVLDLLVELRRDTGLALVLVSHDLGVIRRVCDRVLVMSGGRVVESGPVGAVFDRPEHSVTRELLAARGVSTERRG
ncbi:nickel ABC transporter ATP-binding protein NikE [Cellulomonas taurus]|uniref:nickel ABC transporter ATP-binding protein NikE n=1 Tax=Cellulomonas taurus TaxID=2729175 RepID=UPI00145CC962|nr:ABC transporter ATP-binding protein [Cellulomonas taurus]